MYCEGGARIVERQRGMTVSRPKRYQIVLFAWRFGDLAGRRSIEIYMYKVLRMSVYACIETVWMHNATSSRVVVAKGWMQKLVASQSLITSRISKFLDIIPDLEARLASFERNASCKIPFPQSCNSDIPGALHRIRSYTLVPSSQDRSSRVQYSPTRQQQSS